MPTVATIADRVVRELKLAFCRHRGARPFEGVVLIGYDPDAVKDSGVVFASCIIVGKEAFNLVKGDFSTRAAKEADGRLLLREYAYFRPWLDIEVDIREKIILLRVCNVNDLRVVGN